MFFIASLRKTVWGEVLHNCKILIGKFDMVYVDVKLGVRISRTFDIVSPTSILITDANWTDHNGYGKEKMRH